MTFFRYIHFIQGPEFFSLSHAFADIIYRLGLTIFLSFSRLSTASQMLHFVFFLSLRFEVRDFFDSLHKLRVAVRICELPSQFTSRGPNLKVAVLICESQSLFGSPASNLRVVVSICNSRSQFASEVPICKSRS